MYPKVTVGMPTFNRGDLLQEAINQILSQSFQNFELIICNDGSTDNTSEILGKINDGRVIVLNRPNKGIPHPINTILEHAKGEYIIILHDHDIFHTDLLKKAVEILDQYPKIGFVLPGSAWVTEDGITGYKKMLLELPLINSGLSAGKKMLLNTHSFSSFFHACSMIRKSVWKNCGLYYDPKYGFYSDIDLWLRLLLKNDFFYIKEVLITFRERERSGHLMSNKDFQVLDWLFSIHYKHIHEFFGSSDRALQKAKKNLEKKRIELALTYLLKSILRKRKTLMEEGVKYLNLNPPQNFVHKFIFFLLAKSTFILKRFYDI